MAPRSLTTGDQTVVCVRRRKRRQKGECLPAQVADAAPNSDPIVRVVVSLFASAAVADNRVTKTNGTAPQKICAGSPIDCEFVLLIREWDKQNRSDAEALLPGGRPDQDLRLVRSLPPSMSTEEE